MEQETIDPLAGVKDFTQSFCEPKVPSIAEALTRVEAKLKAVEDRLAQLTLALIGDETVPVLDWNPRTDVAAKLPPIADRLSLIAHQLDRLCESLACPECVDVE